MVIFTIPEFFRFNYSESSQMQREILWYHKMASPLGGLLAVASASGLRTLEFRDDAQVVLLLDRLNKSGEWELKNEMNPILEMTQEQLQEYFHEKRTTFSIPLEPHGTEFQCSVWMALQQVPFGKTSTYTRQAAYLGNPLVIRAMASANGKNPIAIIIPCHRVIGSDGSLTGYAGGLWRKQWLLEHEGALAKQENLF